MVERADPSAPWTAMSNSSIVGQRVTGVFKSTYFLITLKTFIRMYFLSSLRRSSRTLKLPFKLIERPQKHNYSFSSDCTAHGHHEIHLFFNHWMVDGYRSLCKKQKRNAVEARFSRHRYSRKLRFNEHSPWKIWVTNYDFKATESIILRTNVR